MFCANPRHLRYACVNFRLSYHPQESASVLSCQSIFLKPLKTSEVFVLIRPLMLTLGSWLRWRLLWLFSDAEEAAKDKKITKEEAR